jgi:cell division protease FtsH
MNNAPIPAESTPDPRGARHPQERSWWSELKNVFTAPPGRRPSKSIPPRARFSLWYFVVAMVLLLLIEHMFLTPTVHRLSYSGFKQMVRDNKVENVVLTQDEIRGRLKEAVEIKGRTTRLFTTVRVNDPELIQLLDQHNV